MRSSWTWLPTPLPTRLSRAPITAVLILALALVAGGFAAGGATVTAQEDGSPAPVIQPIAGGWSLLANTGPAVSPADLLAPIEDLVTAAFTFDPTRNRFRAYRPGVPERTDLVLVETGEALWVFVPPARLDGDIAFLEVPASASNLPTTLEPGFTLVGWTGTDGLRVSEATEGLPVRRAYQWEAASQRYRTWIPSLPAAARDDFPLEYGAGLWIDLGGDESVVWEQR